MPPTFRLLGCVFCGSLCRPTASDGHVHCLCRCHKQSKTRPTLRAELLDDSCSGPGLRRRAVTGGASKGAAVSHRRRRDRAGPTSESTRLRFCVRTKDGRTKKSEFRTQIFSMRSDELGRHAVGPKNLGSDPRFFDEGQTAVLTFKVRTLGQLSRTGPFLS